MQRPMEVQRPGGQDGPAEAVTRIAFYAGWLSAMGAVMRPKGIVETGTESGPGSRAKPPAPSSPPAPSGKEKHVGDSAEEPARTAAPRGRGASTSQTASPHPARIAPTPTD